MSGKHTPIRLRPMDARCPTCNANAWNEDGSCEVCSLRAAAPDLLAALEAAPIPLAPHEVLRPGALIDWHQTVYLPWFKVRAAALAKVKA